MSVLCSGSYVADIIVPGLKDIGPPGSLTYAPKGIQLKAGGHSANVAIDLVQLGRQRVHSVGCVGDDKIGKFMVETIKSSGVAVHPEIVKDSTTAKNVALIVEGEDRRYIAELTANALLSTQHVISHLKMIEPVFLYLGTIGGLKFVDPELTRIINVANNIGALNLVDPIMPIKSWSHLEKAFPLIDIIHSNVSEAKNLTRNKDIAGAASYLIEKGVKLAVVSDGSRGLIAKTSKVLIKMPAFKVEEVDPTGAGDALCAGVINSIMSKQIKHLNEVTNKDLIEVLLEAQAAGAACVTDVGATTKVNRVIQKSLIDEQGRGIIKNTKIV
jgi:ribokinase